jgi:iron complex outermembrane receptor protein
MKGKLLFSIAFAMIPALSYGQSAGVAKDIEKMDRIDSVVIYASRADRRTPVAHTTVGRETLQSISSTTSLPMALSLQPSVVTMNEGGTGFGYSRMRVRGSDGTRINVTLNGVTLNDAESQEVFWVNMPSLTEMLQSVQLQRGLGTSVNGPGAFGASVNMQTLLSGDEPYAKFDAGYGSYNSRSIVTGFGTGRLKNGLFFDAGAALNGTEGYIRNAWGHVGSIFAQAGWIGTRDVVKLIYIMGKEHTGITWNGIPKDSLATNRTYNSAGEYYDDEGNLHYYGNESDNYTQHHFQLFYSHEFSDRFFVSSTLHFTRGSGYYEEYKYDKKLSGYGLEPQTIGDTEYKKSDFIIRQAMDNDFVSFSLNADYLFKGGKWVSGLNTTSYDGLHFGRMLWSKYNENIADDYEWYSNRGRKKEANAYSRVEKSFAGGRASIYADVQARYINLVMDGTDKDLADLGYSKNYFFFNPKAGFSYDLPEGTVYASVSIGHKEASRDDIKDAIKSSKGDSIRPERMVDLELGYKVSTTSYAFGINLYDMEYKNQLVETGKISETGYSIKQNVPRSYRRGVELIGAAKLCSWLRADANMTLSSNKILGYTCYVDTYDNDENWNTLAQTREYYAKTDLILSPNLIGMARLTATPLKGLEISAHVKSVGKQYYDNTSSDDRALDPYNVVSASASYLINFKTKTIFNGSSLKLSIFANNIFNEKYCSEAWVYRAFFKDTGTTYIEDGLFPQACRNFSR